jgi:hypothetical protein
VTDRLWEVADIVALVEAKEAVVAPEVRGPYKERLAMLSGKPDLEE